MPRGESPNSRANLSKGKKFSAETAKKAQEKSLEVKRKLKTFKELDDETTTDAERQKMLNMLKKRAEQGNLKAFELYATFMGMKPTDKVQIQTIDSSTIDGLKSALDARAEDDDVK